jgi:nicotinamidase-related amidase
VKKTILSIAVFISIMLNISAQTSHKALLIIDIQDFYFPGGKSALVEPEKAAANAALLLTDFRKKNMKVIHVRHNSEPGGKINDIVKPLPSEKIISKDAVNSFLGTDLLEFLKANKTDTLVICGMQTHMCVEAATRAASDYGFKCILIHDACATKDLKFGDYTIKAADVHYSTLSTLKSYAVVQSSAEYLKK